MILEQELLILPITIAIYALYMLTIVKGDSLQTKGLVFFIILGLIIIAYPTLKGININKVSKSASIQEEIYSIIDDKPLELKVNMLNSRCADGRFLIEENIEFEKLESVFKAFDILLYDKDNEGVTHFIIIRDSKALRPNSQYHGKYDFSKGE